MKRKFLSFLAAGMLFTLPAAAQSVGVVMSGGGAKGLYHIGVLQALEESGIPIDYVSGTSMGSIIAGMYAAGYSPEEMRRIVASGVVKQWVSGRIDPSYLPYYRRNTGTPIFLSIRLNMKDRPDDPNASRFRLPSYRSPRIRSTWPSPTCSARPRQLPGGTSTARWCRSSAWRAI